MRHRRGPALATFIAAVAVLAPWPQGAASASCAAPTLRVDAQAQPVVARGVAVTVHGRYFVNGCNDTGTGSGSGCSGRPKPEPVTPRKEVALSIRQGARTWALGTADADRQGRVTWIITTPADLRPGQAVLLADSADQLRVLVRK